MYSEIDLDRSRDKNISIIMFRFHETLSNNNNSCKTYAFFYYFELYCTVYINLTTIIIMTKSKPYEFFYHFEFYT